MRESRLIAAAKRRDRFVFAGVILHATGLSGAEIGRCLVPVSSGLLITIKLRTARNWGHLSA